MIDDEKVLHVFSLDFGSENRKFLLEALSVNLKMLVKNVSQFIE